jgi:hemoglobin
MPEARDETPDTDAPFVRLGGEAGVRALVDRFYDLMDEDARFVRLRSLHPPQLAGSRDKLHWFLCGWLGGPALYVERLGHPRLRARHLPFAIGTVERDQWLLCMAEAMAHEGIEGEFFDRLLGSFYKTADWMRNLGNP